MPLLDFHMHFFSRPFFDALASLSPLPGQPDEKLAALAQATGIELPEEGIDAHTRRWLSQMDAHQVEHMAAFASAPQEIPALEHAARVAAGRLTPFAVLDPTAEGAAERADALIERGFAGVLLFPAMHHYDLAGPEARALFGVLAEHRAIAFVHCGLLVVKLRDLLGLPRAYDLTLANPLRLIPAAQAFPDAHFVIPHFGAGLFRETLMAGVQCPNIHVDTSSSNSWIATQPERLDLAGVFERALQVFGSERVLFGTDSNVFPAGWRHERYLAQRDVLDSLGLSLAEKDRVFAENARRLLGGVQRVTA